MLTAKQNMIETIRGGNPDRFVNQYEAVQLLFSPTVLNGVKQVKGGPDIVNEWGVTRSFPENVPAGFPVHTPDKIVVKDIENWRDYVHAPNIDFTDEQWAQFRAQYDAVDGNESFKATFIAPGLFEQCHHLCEITNALTYYITNPDEMHELIEYLTQYELKLAEGICKHLQPDAIFHHDDWGGEKSSFLSPEMFEEFFLEPYKRIYGYYHDHGVQLIIHHADSYAANLVPTMIKMGIDIWQGCMYSNNIPELIKQYGGQISFMGGIDNKMIDFDGWTREDCKKAARKLIDECGDKYYIPCITQGGPGSVYKGAYAVLSEEIDAYSAEKFGIKVEDITRLPFQIMF